MEKLKTSIRKIYGQYTRFCLKSPRTGDWIILTAYSGERLFGGEEGDIDKYDNISISQKGIELDAESFAILFNESARTIPKRYSKIISESKFLEYFKDIDRMDRDRTCPNY